MKKVANARKHNSLVIVNLATDKNNVALSFTSDWIDEFSKRYSVVRVWSVHVGDFDLPSNVKVTELGGGSLRKRIFLPFKISSIVFYLIRKPKSDVFYHMNASVAVMVGPILKILKVPQILWYSHAYPSVALKIAVKLVDRVVSTSTESFPLSTTKLISTGHGVRDQEVIRTRQDMSTPSISFLGRVSRVKRIELLINEVSTFQNSHNRTLKIYILGPCEGALDRNYKLELLALAKERFVELIFVGSVPYKNVQFELSKHEFAYNGTLKSLDKGAIESVFAQSILLSDQKNTLTECGYSKFSLTASGEVLRISEQLNLMTSLSEVQRSAMIENAKKETLARHSLSSTITKICNQFESIKSSP